MKKIFFFVNILLYIILVYSFSMSEEIKSSPISAAFLRLYSDNDKEISLGSMLLSAHAGFEDCDILIDYIKNNRYKKEDIIERTIKNYAYSFLQYGTDKKANEKFIKEFPNNKNDLNALLEFEGKIKSPPFSYLLEGLLIFAKNGNKEALIKINELHKLVNGWGWVQMQLDMK